MPRVSMTFDPTRRILLGAICCAPALCLAPSAFAANLVQTGSLTIEQVQIAFIGSGNLGGGTLIFNGQKYGISVGGLGIGGFGISKMQAHGAVYNLYDLGDFPGAYVQARYGLAVGSTSTGQLWLRNARGVALRLDADRSGLALSLGGDAVYIDFD
jgi:hypothetical protein